MQTPHRKTLSQRILPVRQQCLPLCQRATHLENQQIEILMLYYSHQHNSWSVDFCWPAVHLSLQVAIQNIVCPHVKRTLKRCDMHVVFLSSSSRHFASSHKGHICTISTQSCDQNLMQELSSVKVLYACIVFHLHLSPLCFNVLNLLCFTNYNILRYFKVEFKVAVTSKIHAFKFWLKYKSISIKTYLKYQK